MALGVYLRQLGIDPVEERLFEVKNVRLEVTSCGTGDKLALCLHGFPEHAYSWRHQVQMLVKMGYRVWVPNLRGYGRSDKPKGVRNYAIGELVQDIAGLLDIAKAKEVILIGHDWGAMIAWEFALRRIRSIDRLVIMNVPHPAIFAERVREPYQRKRSWYIWFFQIPFVPELLLRLNRAQLVGRVMKQSATVSDAFTRDVLHVYRDNALRRGAVTAMLNYYRANFFRKAPQGLTTEPDVPMIYIPTLMIWGENDTALDLRLVPGTDKYVRHLTVKTLSQAAHWVQQEAPEQVNDILQTWLTTPETTLTAPAPSAAVADTAPGSFTDVRPMDVAAPAAAYTAETISGHAPTDIPPPSIEKPLSTPDTVPAPHHSESDQPGGPFEDIRAGAEPGSYAPPAPAERGAAPESGATGEERTEKTMMDWIDWRKPRTPKTEQQHVRVDEAPLNASPPDAPPEDAPESPANAPLAEMPPQETATDANNNDVTTDNISEPEHKAETERKDPVPDVPALEDLDAPRPLKKTMDRAPEPPAPDPADVPEAPRKVHEPLILTREQMLSPAQAVQAHIRLLRQRLCFENL